ncbi:Hypothetical predicted protein [Paramuricea clavata]|uniref:Uncharacterized protein n=1 Tax=Paramuricea clavata TaxID=317549 RepID=A0A6S7FYW5_PARCT|nr:Hypothetical predicted protein [Paramuricea clavata]
MSRFLARHGDLSYQAKNASGRRKGYMEIMKELWEEKGYASLGYTAQNLRDKAAQVLKTTERTFSNSRTNDVNETSVNYFENEESDLAHNLNNQRCEIHSTEVRTEAENVNEVNVNTTDEDTKQSHFDPILYNRITSDTIRDAANKIQGSAGLSSIDAHLWHRFCLSYKMASSDLCNALAGVARRLCTKSVHPEGLSAFVACRLIPLDKDPGIRPICIGEVPRHIIAKAILRVVRDVKEAVGPLQTCAGFEAGCEAAVHALNHIWDSEDTEGMLLVDATNAFNTLNRKAVLHNIQATCPVRIFNRQRTLLQRRKKALPTRHGDLNLPNPVDLAKISQTMSYERLQVHEIKAELRQQKNEFHQQLASDVRKTLSPQKQRIMDLLKEKVHHHGYLRYL